MTNILDTEGLTDTQYAYLHKWVNRKEPSLGDYWIGFVTHPLAILTAIAYILIAICPGTVPLYIRNLTEAYLYFYITGWFLVTALVLFSWEINRSAWSSYGRTYEIHRMLKCFLRVYQITYYSKLNKSLELTAVILLSLSLAMNAKRLPIILIIISWFLTASLEINTKSMLIDMLRRLSDEQIEDFDRMEKIGLTPEKD